MHASRSSHDFTNASAPCLTGIVFTGNGSVCSNPDSFVFWDGAHPTSAAHRVLGDAFAAAVPEPATLTLLGLGMALGFRSRRVSRSSQGLQARS